MAARTLTYTQNMAASPRGTVTGPAVVPWDFNAGTALFGTLSDMLLLGKIPNGALITRQDVRLGATKQDNAHFGLLLMAVEADGTLSTWATLIASMTASSTAAAVFQSYIPKKVSLSDDRAVQHVILALNCTTGPSETASFSTQGSVEYYTNGQTV